MPRQYAAALRASVSDLATFERCLGDLQRIVECFRGAPDIHSFFMDRRHPIASRVQVCTNAVGGVIADAAHGLLRLLLAHHALALLPAIVATAVSLADAEAHRSRVFVESAHPLTESLHVAITGALRAALSREPVVTYAVRSTLIAGLRVTINGTRQWDGTIAGRLRQLEQRLATAA